MSSETKIKRVSLKRKQPAATATKIQPTESDGQITVRWEVHLDDGIRRVQRRRFFEKQPAATQVSLEEKADYVKTASSLIRGWLGKTWTALCADVDWWPDHVLSAYGTKPTDVVTWILLFAVEHVQGRSGRGSTELQLLLSAQIYKQCRPGSDTLVRKRRDEFIAELKRVQAVFENIMHADTGLLLDRLVERHVKTGKPLVRFNPIKDSWQLIYRQSVALECKEKQPSVK